MRHYQECTDFSRIADETLAALHSKVTEEKRRSIILDQCGFSGEQRKATLAQCRVLSQPHVNAERIREYICRAGVFWQ